MSQAGIVDVEGSHPQIPTSFVTNMGTAIPIANVLEILGTTVAAHSIPLETTGSGNTVTIVAQYASAAASSVATNAGFASFDSAFFSVDSHGFVTFTGTGAMETLTGNSGGAVSPTAGNIFTVGTGSITIVGNPGTSTLTTQLTGLTNHNVLVGAGTATITKVPPSTAGFVLTSNGAAADPSFQASGATGTVKEIDGDSGFATPNVLGVIQVYADNLHQNCGCSVSFIAGGNTDLLNLSDIFLNTILGIGAGNSSTVGQSNSGLGEGCFLNLSGGTFHCAVGSGALSNIINGNRCIGIGKQAGSAYTGNESDNIVIGNAGVAGENHVIRIGTQGSADGQQNECFIAGITGVSVSNLNVVTINTATGQLGSQVASSGTVTSVSVVSANGFAGTVATATTTPAITLTTTVTGVLSGNGTALSGSAITQHDVLVGGATNAITSVSPSTSGFILTSNGVSADPSFQAPAASSISITGNSGGALTGNAFTFTGGTTGLTFAGSGTTETLGGDLVVANGGTGNTTFTAYSVICAGTTATGAFQNVSGVGSSGQVLTSNGASALPTWQPAASGGFTTINIQTFTSSGTYTPTANTKYAITECWGGAGAGGSTASAAAGALSVGGGGGGGAYSRKFASAATLGASQTITVGAGGTPGSTGNNPGGNGGTSSVGTLCTAPGGTGGGGNGGSTFAAGGAGGVAGTGDFSIPGQTGASTYVVVSLAPQGAGGSSTGGFGAFGVNTQSTGAAGSLYGGGGSGGSSYNTGAATAGGAGAKGLVVITEYI